VRVLCRHGRIALAAIVMLAAVCSGVFTGSAQQSEVVSRINGDVILRDAFTARLRFVRWQYLRELETAYELTGGNLDLVLNHALTLVENLEQPEVIGDAVLRQMEEERLLWQAGEALGVTPSAEDAQAREAAFFSAWTNTPVEDLAGDAEAQAFIADWYAGAEAASGLSPNDIRIIFETEALRAKLFAYLSASVPTEEPGVHTRHILCLFAQSPPTTEQRQAAEDCATEVRIRLANGEDFAAVARTLSQDPNSAPEGGDLGWSLLNYMVEPYADAVRDAPLNTVIGPVETVYGLHLIEVLERGPQALTEDELYVARQGYFQLWLETLWAEGTVERNPDWASGLPTEPALSSLDQDLLRAIERLKEGV
jgi:parvulin-like peptidyl-prolyl isomerase